VDEETCENFVKEISNHYESLAQAVPLLAQGITEGIIGNPSATQISSCPSLNNFLNRFHLARISTRLLTGHFSVLYAQHKKSHGDELFMATSSLKRHMVTSPTNIGMLNLKTNPKEICQLAYDDAARLCQDNFGKVPDIEFITPQFTEEHPLEFTYVPSHLHYTLFELLKNSMRATCEAHSRVNDESELPKIRVIIVANEESNDVTIKLSDRGGGIPTQDMSKIWYYSYTTVVNAPHVTDDLNKNSKPESGVYRAPMAGFGYGLPLSRLYARYFGGDLEIMSMYGYGTDAFLYLNYLQITDTHKLSGELAAP